MGNLDLEGETERAKRTLVFRGWGEPTSRRALLPQLESACAMLKFKHLLDMEPLCGAGDGEAFFHVRARMNSVDSPQQLLPGRRWGGHEASLGRVQQG